jgi:hypothetical protein
MFKTIFHVILGQPFGKQADQHRSQQRKRKDRHYRINHYPGITGQAGFIENKFAQTDSHSFFLMNEQYPERRAEESHQHTGYCTGFSHPLPEKSSGISGQECVRAQAKK